MPKMKTKRSAAKRFRVTGTGKLMRQSAYRYHKAEHKASTRMRRLAGDSEVSPGDAANVRKMLGM